MDESVYVVMHFKKNWTIRDTRCNGFKAQEKMCEHCISWIAGEACERRREALKEKT